MKEVSTVKAMRTLGMILLGVWLLVEGFLKLNLVTINIPYIDVGLAILMIVSGILIIFSKHN
jgi:hypothetical protein